MKRVEKVWASLSKGESINLSTVKDIKRVNGEMQKGLRGDFRAQVNKANSVLKSLRMEIIDKQNALDTSISNAVKVKISVDQKASELGVSASSLDGYNELIDLLNKVDMYNYDLESLQGAVMAAQNQIAGRK